MSTLSFALTIVFIAVGHDITNGAGVVKTGVVAVADAAWRRRLRRAVSAVGSAVVEDC